MALGRQPGRAHLPDDLLEAGPGRQGQPGRAGAGRHAAGPLRPRAGRLQPRERRRRCRSTWRRRGAGPPACGWPGSRSRRPTAPVDLAGLPVAARRAGRPRRRRPGRRARSGRARSTPGRRSTSRWPGGRPAGRPRPASASCWSTRPAESGRSRTAPLGGDYPRRALAAPARSSSSGSGRPCRPARRPARPACRGALAAAGAAPASVRGRPGRACDRARPLVRARRPRAGRSRLGVGEVATPGRVRRSAVGRAGRAAPVALHWQARAETTIELLGVRPPRRTRTTGRSPSATARPAAGRCRRPAGSPASSCATSYTLPCRPASSRASTACWSACTTRGPASGCRSSARPAPDAPDRVVRGDGRRCGRWPAPPARRGARDRRCCAWRARRRGWREGWSADGAAAGALLLASIGFFWQLWLLPDVSVPRGGGDLASFLYPTYRFAAESIQRGSLPVLEPAPLRRRAVRGRPAERPLLPAEPARLPGRPPVHLRGARDAGGAALPARGALRLRPGPRARPAAPRRARGRRSRSPSPASWSPTSATTTCSPRPRWAPLALALVHRAARRGRLDWALAAGGALRAGRCCPATPRSRSTRPRAHGPGLAARRRARAVGRPARLAALPIALGARRGRGGGAADPGLRADAPVDPLRHHLPAGGRVRRLAARPDHLPRPAVLRRQPGRLLGPALEPAGELRLRRRGRAGAGRARAAGRAARPARRSRSACSACSRSRSRSARRRRCTAGSTGWCPASTRCARPAGRCSSSTSPARC